MISIGPRSEKSTLTAKLTANPAYAIVIQVAELARNLQERARAGEIDETFGKLLDAAVDCVPGAQHAAITLGGRDEVETLWTTTGHPPLLAEIQQRHEGLCRATTPHGRIIHIDDVSAEARWPGYCRDVADETPIRSIMTIQLFTDRHGMGALNFYAERPHAFDAESTELGIVAATHVGLAWSVLRHDQQFHRALLSRDLIGQAKGIVMERFNINATRAFELLSRLSQNSNTPVIEIARRLVEARPVRP